MLYYRNLSKHIRDGCWCRYNWDCLFRMTQSVFCLVPTFRNGVLHRWSVFAEPPEGTVSQTLGSPRGGRALLYPRPLQVRAFPQSASVTESSDSVFQLCSGENRLTFDFCSRLQWNSDQVWPLPGPQCPAGTRPAVSAARQKRWRYQTARNSKVSLWTSKAYLSHLYLIEYVWIRYSPTFLL